MYEINLKNFEEEIYLYLLRRFVILLLPKLNSNRPGPLSRPAGAGCGGTSGGGSDGGRGESFLLGSCLGRCFLGSNFLLDSLTEFVSILNVPNTKINISKTEERTSDWEW
jgi:hypothetical protein